MTQFKKRKHGKTSQETQSSVTKLFKKFGKPAGSSSSERQNLLKQKKGECKCPASGGAEQKDSGLPKRDDTFSCTSCALMKLLTSDPPKLLFLFTIACIFILILLALNSCSFYKDPSSKVQDETRKRRSNGEWMEDDRMSWETSTSTLLNRASELLASDSGGYNVHGGNMDNPSQELSNILDPVKVSAAYSSNSLRDFYRKLLRTDIHIKKLRTCLNNLKREKTNNFFDFNPLRKKRSLKIFRNGTRKLVVARLPFLHKHSVKHYKKLYPPRLALRADNDIYKDIKENTDIYATPDPNSAPENTKDTFTSFPDSQTFQHLDRKMQAAIGLFHNQFPETTPKMFVSTLNSKENHKFQPDIYLKYNTENAREEKARNDEGNDFTPTIKPYSIPQEELENKDPYLSRQNFELIKQTVLDSNINVIPNVDNALVHTETNPPEQTDEFTVTLTSITTVKPGSKFRKEQADHNIHNEYFLKRRLLQHNDNDDEDNDDEDDDSDVDFEDQTKEPWDREKRSINPMGLGIKYKSDQPREFSTFDNTYWKGPVYHDELDQMIKAALEMESRKPSAKKKEKIKSNPVIGTHGYTAKYTEITKANYDKLAAMAQAYSDYGVLDGKKEIVENMRRQENTVNLMTLEKKHEMSQPKLGNDVLFRKVGLIKCVKVVSSDHIPEKNAKNLPIHTDDKAGASQDITDAKRSQEFNKPNMYDHHNIYKRSLKSVETEVPNNETPADSNIKSGVNDTMKLSVTEHSYLKDNYLFVTPTENNKIANSSKTEDSDALEKIGNRTVVKRSANGYIRSWNDLYDDEYGVKDPLENEMKDKSSVKYNDLIAKSENWLGAKFKQIANNVKERKYYWKQRMIRNQHFKDSRISSISNPTHEISKINEATSDILIVEQNKSNFTKRAVDNPNKNSGKQTFKALTANMKKVIHEAAEAIRETTSREARSDNVQAATMMQRLVGLMSELVDIQVKQKTCVQLPEDLRSFLAWLTTPNPQENNDINYPADSTYDAGSGTKNILKTDYDMMPSNARNECLGTIHDIQDLIEQYDEMSEEDKSKMSGVREYLEHQLKFLHKQLSSFNEYEVPVMYQEPFIRKRRQLSKSSKDKKIPFKRKTHSDHNYFDRKHTKTTAHDGVIDEVTQHFYNTNRKNDNNLIKNDLEKVNGRNENGNIKKGHDDGETDLKHLEDNVIKNKDENENTALNIKSLGNNVKRNLQDIYYGALAMAKANATTVKSL